MPEPTTCSPAYSSSAAPDVPFAVGATLLTLVCYFEPAARIPAGALALTSLLLLLLGAVRRRLAFARPPRA